jgi:hypothetical protein
VNHLQSRPLARSRPLHFTAWKGQPHVVDELFTFAVTSPFALTVM